MKDLVAPVFAKLVNAGYKDSILAIVENYLGAGGKISKATESDVEKLQFIYNKLIDFAEEYEIEVE